MSDIDLNAPEVQKAIKAAVADAVTEATKPLADKNKELLTELKTARKNQEITPEALEAVEAERDKFKAERDVAVKAAKTANETAEKAVKGLESESGFTTSLLVDNGLNAELIKAGVDNPVLLKAVKSMLKGLVTIETEGDKRVAKVGDKTLSEHIETWAKSDEGKNFVSASHNSGGGSNGDGGSGGANKKFSEHTGAELKAIRDRDPAEYERLKKAEQT